MDVLTKEQRRKNMQNIKSKDTSIELALRKALWNAGYRYRKNYKKLPGKPDIALTRYKIAVFCDSEFFHGKDWDTLKTRLSRSDKGEYWINKIERNMNRDNEVEKELQYLGWKVIRFWGKDIKKNTEACVQVIREAIFDELIGKSELR
ncbi:very short patch repair endonuclease [Lachnotalea glycerini]|uniref:Very short patch repair endonuclease n=1 Tax=Lachnotalea glycerini TaxID=1763509 RepID=A0A371JE18_9FIRM|nr:very short patch repair endonuclease [Lachnotalea glycerini]RDY30965.1 very short patch repair endonuclease [Lachnotalea glycerini]